MLLGIIVISVKIIEGFRPGPQNGKNVHGRTYTEYKYQNN